MSSFKSKTHDSGKRRNGKPSSWQRHTLWSYYFEGDVDIPEICIESLTFSCPLEREGCSRLHANKKWQWQVVNNNQWHNLTEKQSDRLERRYLDVEVGTVVLPPLDVEKTGKLGEELFKLMGRNSWRVDFTQMKMFSPGEVSNFSIRRLSTPANVICDSKYSTDFKWFLQKNSSWIEFGDSLKTDVEQICEADGFSNSTISTDIEKQYQKGQSSFMTVNVANKKCKLDFIKMILIYKKSRDVYPVRRRPINSEISYPIVWSYHIQGDVDKEEICMDTFGEKCVRVNGCGKLHCDEFWHWQLLYGGIWYNMPRVQRKILEKAFLDVWENDVELPAITPSKMGNLGIVMTEILGTSKWLADFDTMSMTSMCKSGSVGRTLRMRRLSTPSVLKSTDENATKFVWFYKNKCDTWVEFGTTKGISSSSEYSFSITSYKIEKCYESQKWNTISIPGTDNKFDLCFTSMMLCNINTGERIPVRRRPHYARTRQIKQRTKMNVSLSTTSREYHEVSASLYLSLKLPEVVTIWRIQNSHLWQKFENKMDAFSSQFSSDVTMNIHSLFHWVTKDVIEDITSNNFEWKHQCPEIKTNNKNAVVFYRSAEFPHKTCSSSPSDHRLLVFRVIVGKIRDSKADSSPNAWSTDVDNCSMPNTYMKYCKEDYYPQYIIKL